MLYNKEEHVLLRDRAHKSRIYEDGEFNTYLNRLRDVGVEIIDVEVPNWPPAQKSVLQYGGGNPFEGQSWSGIQPACVKRSETTVELYRHGSFVLYDKAGRVAASVAREMGGDLMQPYRLSYQWQVPVYNEEDHAIIRYFCEDNDIDIVDFYRDYLPKLRAKLERDPVFEVVNPNAAEDKERWGQWSPTRRAVSVGDAVYLDEYLSESVPFEYNLSQTVKWQRALDDSRWEARRQVEPQSAEWMSHKSYIMRPIGSGAWTEVDRDPEVGHAFGPFMELYDDGRLYVWVSVRAKPVLLELPMYINGVSVQLSVGDEVSNSVTMQAILSDSDREQVLENRIAVDDVVVTDDDEQEVDTFNVRVNFRQNQNGAFYSTPDDVVLPSQYNRVNGSRITLKRKGNRSEVRVFGDEVLLTVPIVLNNVTVSLSTWKTNSYRAIVSEETIDVILSNNQSVPKPKPQLVYIEETPVLVPEFEDDVVKPPAVDDGVVAYPSGEVIRSLRDILGSSVRLFGRQSSDSVVMALTPEGANQYLREDLTDLRAYVGDTGSRNYDCDNFAESVRVHLSERYGLNSIGVIWGDRHAFNFVVINGDNGPEIMMFEPQDDREVDIDDGMYSTVRRCEVLL